MDKKDNKNENIEAAKNGPQAEQNNPTTAGQPEGRRPIPTPTPVTPNTDNSPSKTTTSTESPQPPATKVDGDGGTPVASAATAPAGNSLQQTMSDSGAIPSQSAPAATSAAAYGYNNVEDGAISDKAPLVLVQPGSPTLDKLKTNFSQDEFIRVLEIPRNNLAAVVKELYPCIIISALGDGPDVVLLVNVLKQLKRDLKANKAKFIIFSKVNNPGIIRVFESLGCKEFIIEPIADKSLMHKMSLHTKALKAQRKQMRHTEMTKNELIRTGKLTDGSQSLEAEEEDKKANVKVDNAHEIAEDVWVFKKNKPKKQGGKWTIRMQGPAPETADWQQVGEDEEGNPQWRFMEKEGDKLPTPEEAKKKPGWQFSGDKPSFNNGEWNFAGKKPDLSYVDENGKKKASKVRNEGGELVVAEDSKVALEKASKQDEKNKQELEKKKRGIFIDTEESPSADAAKNDDGQTSKKGAETKSKTKGQSDLMDFGDDDDSKSSEGGKDSTKKQGKGLGSNSTTGDKNDKESKNPFAKQKEDANSPGSKKEKAKALGVPADSDETDGESKPSEKNIKSKGIRQKGSNDFLDENTESENSDTQENQANDKAERNPFNFKKNKNDKNAKGEFLNELEDESADNKSKSKDKAKSKLGQKPGATNEDAEDDPKSVDKNPFALKKKNKPDKMLNEAEEKDKNDPSLLSSMAMQFDEGPAAFNDKVKNEKKEAIGGKDDAKTEHIENSDWQMHDLTPEELMALKERQEAQKKYKGVFDKEGKGKKGKKTGLGDLEDADADGDSDSDDSSKSAGFKAKKKPKGFDFDKGDPDADYEGGWSKHAALDKEQRKHWSARDSQEDGEVDSSDKLVEVEAVSGSLKAKKGAEPVYFDFPQDHFGDINGIWQSTGSDPRDPSKTKIYLFVLPDLNKKSRQDVMEANEWWIFTGERPLFLAPKKQWRFKDAKPRKILSFTDLPKVVADFILEILKGTQKIKSLEEFVEEQKTFANKKDLEASPTKPPSVLALYIHMTDFLITTKGDYLQALDLFMDRWSSKMPGIRFTLAYFENRGQTLSVVASSDGERPKGMNLEPAKEKFAELFKTCLQISRPLISNDGALALCPISSPMSTSGVPVGMLFVESVSESESLGVDVKYIENVAQCLRGVLAESISKKDSNPKKSERKSAA